MLRTVPHDIVTNTSIPDNQGNANTSSEKNVENINPMSSANLSGSFTSSNFNANQNSDSSNKRPKSNSNPTENLGSIKNEPKISFGFWNVEGLYEKLHMSSLCDFIQSLDIAGLGETFTLPGFDFTIKFPNHYALHCPATKYTRLGRPSGGIVLLIKKTLYKYIEIVDTQISHVLAIKIKKCLFRTDKDILLVMIYNHPSESIFYKHKNYYSTLEQLDQFIANSIETGQEFDLIIGGDINARVGDWAYTDDGEDMFDDSQTTFERESQDTIINGHGRTLIEFCTTYGLTPLSGLKEKNFLSKFTFIGHRGSSIVDHIVTSTSLLNHISMFSTIDRIESNHLPVIMKMDCKSGDVIEEDYQNEEPVIKNKRQEGKKIGKSKHSK